MSGSYFMELVKKRRSVRDFSDKSISRDDLSACIEAARYAPSACNSQPWRFIVIDDPQILHEISDKAISGIHKMNSFASKAKAMIVILSERQKLIPGIGSTIQQTDFKLTDIGIACSHLVLGAQDLGIGTCILGWFNKKELKKILSITGTARIELLIAMGYPAAAPKHEKMIKPQADTVSFNKY
ncbi:MAG TPA: nitroreductase family protein [Candidatus Omnitrophota bacterium]|nr:nitroreductase family protein [Candidatus Omnitrophota bacterium]HPS20191.1 nitroreductase family protein [Candidatus Omnitrophota bacterium]